MHALEIWYTARVVCKERPGGRFKGMPWIEVSLCLMDDK